MQEEGLLVATQHDPAELFLAHRKLLLWIGSQRFRVPLQDAECLVQDIFLSFLESADQIRSPRRWLIGAMVHASLAYWRRNGRDARVASEERSSTLVLDVIERIVGQLTVREVLQKLGKPCRSLLLRRYFEDESHEEIAAKLQTTGKTIKTALHRCLQQLRLTYKWLA